MTSTDRTTRLQELARMILDVDLANLRKAADARAETAELLVGLTRPFPPSGLSILAESQAMVRYNRWADATRAEANRTLARQTAACLDARDVAIQSFARAEALRLVLLKLAKR